MELNFAFPYSLVTSWQDPTFNSLMLLASFRPNPPRPRTNTIGAEINREMRMRRNGMTEVGDMIEIRKLKYSTTVFDRETFAGIRRSRDCRHVRAYRDVHYKWWKGWHNHLIFWREKQPTEIAPVVIIIINSSSYCRSSCRCSINHCCCNCKGRWEQKAK